MARRAKLLIVAGIVLILLSLGGLLATRIISGAVAENSNDILSQMDQILPNRTTGLPGTYRNTDMPVLQLDGQDLIAILEIPDYGVRLPVCAHWEQGSALGIPRRFTGSAYDNSLIIGGNDQPGQFDCFDRIPLDTRIIITDMTGAEFTYTVEYIQRADSAEAHILDEDAYDLTLFTRGSTTMDYLILRCVQ